MTSLRDTVLNPNPYLRRLSPPQPSASSSALATSDPSKLPSHQIVYPTSRQTFLSAPRSSHAVPPLQELCLRALIHLSPSSNSNSPATPYLKHTLEATHLRSSSALHSHLVSSEHIPSHLVPLPTCARLLAAVRSATRTVRHDFDTGGWGSGEALDDAGEDPFYSACPNPVHKEKGEEGKRMWVEEKGEERTEWCAVPGAGAGDLYPVRWEGCGRGCLRFLDDDVEDEDEQKGEEDCAGEMAEAEVDGQGSWGAGPAKGKRTVGFAEEAEQEEEGSEDGFDIDEFGGGESAF